MSTSTSPAVRSSNRRRGVGSGIARGRRGLVGVLAAVSVALAASPAAAASPAVAAQPATADPGQAATWSVRPADNDHGTARPNYQYGAEPGQRIDDALVVTNYSSGPQTLQVYAADGFTTADGLLDLRGPGVAPSGLARWITVGTSQITVAPGERVTVPFTIEVPADASPGDHPGGVVTSIRSQGSSNLEIDRRLASRINLRVAGEVRVAATVTDVALTYRPSANPLAAGSTVLTYRLTNTGNARLHADETLEIAGPLGVAGLAPVVTQSPEVLPGNTIERQLVVEDGWPVARLAATISATPVGVGVAGAQPAITATAATWAIPWTWLGLLAVLAAAAYLTARRVNGRPRGR